MNHGSNRKFGIVTDFDGLQQGIIVNNISFSNAVDIAQARDQYGRVTDIAVYSQNFQVTIDGLYIRDALHAGSIITISNKNFLVTSTNKNETNVGFETASINARYVPSCFYWPLSATGAGSHSGTIYSEAGQTPPPPPSPTISLSPIPNISWDFENTSTSAINFSSYVTYDGSSNLVYTITETLPTGISLNGSILSADKSLMEDDVDTTLTLNVSASDVLSTATEQFGFKISNVIQPVDIGDSLRFTAVNSSGSVQLSQFGSPDSVQLQYSINSGAWTNYTIGNTISLNEGDIIAFSGNNNHFSKDFGDFYYFSMNGNIEASGNIQSLMNFSTSATDWCFFNLFYDCSSLKKAPDLSATTLASGCYYCMFQNCTSLTTLPQLPATTLARGCYSNMYQGCTGLSTIPDYYLPAETLTMNCYMYMFKDCTSLTAVPQSLLIASTLTGWCYYGMFEGCTSLSVQPLLNATTLAECCYQGMFKGCTSLHQAPELGAKTLANGCYNEMFYGCSNLDWVRVSFTDWGTDNTQYTLNWLSGVAEQGDFYKPSTLLSTFGPSNIPVNWYVTDQQYDPPEPPTPPPTGDPSDPTIPLTFKGLSSTNAIQLAKAGQPYSVLIDYSKNNGAWTSYTIGDIISLDQNDTVAFSGANDHFSKDYLNLYCFRMSGTIEASGNIQSLLNFSNNTVNSCYWRLFQTCTSLVIPPTLFATTLAPGCYAYMFYCCYSLSTAPQLPATTLTSNCYQSMFEGCTALISAPVLPATTLKSHCYDSMFQNCYSLTSTPSLTATTLAEGCYKEMFAHCSSLVTPPPSLPATTLAYRCYLNMFYGCTALSTAPELPATTLDTACYRSMFYNCSSLTSINVSFTNWTQEVNATQDWVHNVAPTGIFYKPDALSTEFGDSRIPSGWTVVNKT